MQKIILGFFISLILVASAYAENNETKAISDEDLLMQIMQLDKNIKIIKKGKKTTKKVVNAFEK